MVFLLRESTHQIRRERTRVRPNAEGMVVIFRGSVEIKILTFSSTPPYSNYYLPFLWLYLSIASLHPGRLFAIKHNNMTCK